METMEYPRHIVTIVPPGSVMKNAGASFKIHAQVYAYDTTLYTRTVHFTRWAYVLEIEDVEEEDLEYRTTLHEKNGYLSAQNALQGLVEVLGNLQIAHSLIATISE